MMSPTVPNCRMCCQSGVTMQNEDSRLEMEKSGVAHKIS